MYKNRKHIKALVILVMIMVILSFRVIVIKSKYTQIKNEGVLSIKEEISTNDIEKYGYSDILECIRKNIGFKVESINMGDNEKCSVEVIYSGDVGLLYNSLYDLIQSENFLGINTISINKEDKITNISMDFINNK